MRIRVTLVLFVALAVVACRTAPIRDVVNAPLPNATGVATPQQVDEAIWRAGRKLGWKIEPVGPGELRGTLRVKRHVAVVSITHDTKRFSIRYADSQNLRYDGRQIHRNYVAWIE